MVCHPKEKKSVGQSVGSKGQMELSQCGFSQSHYAVTQCDHPFCSIVVSIVVVLV